ncbi:MAG: DUF938 domain-containing protein [Porticoccaceae bacterium]|nr:DUF938 domain-containing protein [Porticoccaceae bacterium]
MVKPFSAACENNREAIESVLKTLLSKAKNVFEIGSGTGQHAVWFAEKLPHLQWYTSDRKDNHIGINQWIEESGLENVKPPIALDVAKDIWPTITVDAVFSSNTAHIMAWPDVLCMFRGASELLATGGLFFLYGPMQYNGVITPQSNVDFNYHLKKTNPAQGIREFDDLDQLAKSQDMYLLKDNTMPANNQLLVWEKR